VLPKDSPSSAQSPASYSPGRVLVREACALVHSKAHFFVAGLENATNTGWNSLSRGVSCLRAIDARDVTTVARYVNFDRVRASLTEQIASGYIRRSGVQPGPLAQQAIVVGLSVADPVIRKLVSPEALSELLAVGWPVAVVPDPPPGTLGLNSDTLGTAWQVFGASRYGLARFEVSAPMALPPANRFRLRFNVYANVIYVGRSVIRSTG